MSSWCLAAMSVILPKMLYPALILIFGVCVYRPAEDLSREAKSSTDVNHNSSTAIMTQSSHGAVKTTAPAVTSSSPAASSNSVLSNFLYGMPMSSKPHPDGNLDFKPMSLLNLGKDRLASWTDKGTSVKDCANSGKVHANRGSLLAIIVLVSLWWEQSET